VEVRRRSARDVRRSRDSNACQRFAKDIFRFPGLPPRIAVLPFMDLPPPRPEYFPTAWPRRS
jgi:hypothetical protein